MWMYVDLVTRCFIWNYFFLIYFVELMREHQKQLEGENNRPFLRL